MSLHNVLLIYSLAASWCAHPMISLGSIPSERIQTNAMLTCRRIAIECLLAANDEKKVKKCFEKLEDQLK